MSSDEQMLVIRKNDFLDKLTPDDYTQLNILHNYVIANKDAYIYFDSRNLNKLYFVKQGYVKIGYVNEEGEEFIKDIVQPGDVFGQFTLEPGSLEGEFAQAHKADTILCAFTIADFQKLLSLRPDLAIVFSKKIGQKLRNLENRLVNLLQKDVRARLLYFFWSLAQQSSAGNEHKLLKIPNFLTHDDIARLTGTSRQTVTTLLNRFMDEGLLTVDRKNIVINNILLLQKEAKVG